MPSKANDSRFHGLVLVDKPSGITSHDVVDEVRRVFGTRRVGHTGTLDPIADGLLVLMIGEATKLAEYLQRCEKSYEGVLKLGVVSDTFDTESELRPGPSPRMPKLEVLQELADAFTGEIEQVPPAHSAKKHQGKKLYEYARAGEKVEVEPRRVNVMDFELFDQEGDEVGFAIDCSSGTYVRSLVNELGQRAGCGAVMKELRRTRAGAFDVDDAVTIEDLQARQVDEASLREVLIPMRVAVPEFPALWLMPEAEQWLRRGQPVPSSLVEFGDHPRPRRGQMVMLCRPMGEAVALGRTDVAPMSPPPRSLAGAPAPWFQPVKLFETDSNEDGDA